MLGLAGQSMGLEFVFLDPSDNPPAASVGPVLKYAYDSEIGLSQLATRSDLITYEFENVPVSALRRIPDETKVYPSTRALELAQDRIAEKRMFQSIDIPVASFRSIDSLADLDRAVADVGLPLVLKTRRLGYDGKGQRVVRQQIECQAAFRALGGGDLIAEQWVPFDREISIIGARRVSGDICIYPLAENEHKNGILNLSRAPADALGLESTARHYLGNLLRHLDYVGTLALELFVVGDKLLANEFAPRVHNSGHWTIEGANTSQFENHLRAILDLPLGDAGMRGYAGMLNFIGQMPTDSVFGKAGGIFLHDYGKLPREGRKLGHVTVLSETAAERDKTLQSLAESLPS